MNARASVLTPLGMSAAPGRAEHISLEGDCDDAVAPARPAHRKVVSTFALNDKMRKRAIELSLLDDHYLQVRSIVRKESLKYVFDLRYLQTPPVRLRHISWGWFFGALLSISAMLAGLWLARSANGLLLTSPEFLGAGLGLIGAIACGLVGIRRTSESLDFKSAHGLATFVSVTGGLGSTKRGKTFFVAMIKSIAAAKAARAQPKQQWLRDEMREHHRLRELGVLTEEEYEQSKARILKAHS